MEDIKNNEMGNLNGTYDLKYESERIRKKINSLEKEMFKVWDNVKSKEFLKISKEIEELTEKYFKVLNKEIGQPLF